MKKTNLALSHITRGGQCHKSLWLYKFKRELRAEQRPQKLAHFRVGANVGRLARELYPGGKDIVFSKDAINNNVDQTKGYIEGGVTTIYGATFVADEVIVTVDILHRGKEGWELYEVKSSTSKKNYEKDIAVQYFVVTRSGIKVTKASLIHIDKHYIRQGDLNVGELFKRVDLTREAVSLQDFVRVEIETLKCVLKNQQNPEIDIGRHCLTPRRCEFMPLCWQHIPEVSVFSLYNMEAESKFELYKDGIICFSDLPREYPLTDAQKIQVEAEVTGSIIRDTKLIKAFLHSVKFPLYFLDFECFQQAIPGFSHLSPYEQIPFQFSLHILAGNSENRFGIDTLIHREFISEPGRDPRRLLAEKLLEYIPQDVCVVAYNMSFEKRVIKGLARLFPEHSDHLLRINSNMIDLLKPFKEKGYYQKEMGGSASIKYVLPALIPDLKYSQLNISNGLEASIAYEALPLIKDLKKVEETKKDLLEYCRLDTYAMVKILEKLFQSVEPG